MDNQYTKHYHFLLKTGPKNIADAYLGLIKAKKNELAEQFYEYVVKDPDHFNEKIMHDYLEFMFTFKQLTQTVASRSVITGQDPIDLLEQWATQRLLLVSLIKHRCLDYIRDIETISQQRTPETTLFCQNKRLQLNQEQTIEELKELLNALQLMKMDLNTPSVKPRVFTHQGH